MEIEVEKVRGLLDQVVQIVRGYPEPGGRLILAAMVYSELHQASIDLGAYGIRGESAVQLLALYPSAKEAAASVRERYGVEITASTLNRLAKR